MFNDKILIASKDSKNKKDGVGASLILMQELREFQENIDKCIEAQEDSTNVEKISKFNCYLEDMYEELLGIASEGIRSIRKKDEDVESQEDIEIAPEKEEDAHPLKGILDMDDAETISDNQKLNNYLTTPFLPIRPL
jgi:hypothetical protein